MSSDPVAAAVADNAGWCDLVCRAHGLPTRRDDRLWSALRRSPDLYPDAVTLSPDTTAAEVLAAVEDGVGASVKDAFAVLDLSAHGFEAIFDGEWIFCPAADRGLGLPDGWSVVSSLEEHGRWTRAHGSGSVLAAALMSDVDFVQRGRAPTAGAVLDTAEPGVVGVSNVFGVPDADGWRAVVAAARAMHGGAPLVGWESGADLVTALEAGFVSVGPLRVWARLP